MPALKSVLLASGGILLFAAAGTCNAQTAAAASTSQSDTEASTGIQEIVVTAQRRSESEQRVPVPITAIGAAELQAQGVGAITDLQNAVPSLQTATAGNSVTTFLRGVGSVVNAPGADPEVALYVDGVYYPSPAAANLAFNNIASIEVDKGPQGTLFGRNATGGVIQINTLEPTQTPRFDMTLGYANYHTNEETMYASGGVMDNLAADIAVYNREQGGWGHNLYTGASIYGRQESAVRSKWVYTPSNDTKVTFIADFDHNEGYQGAALNLITGTTVTGGTPQPFYDVSTDTKASENNTQYGFSLKVDHDSGWMRVVSISADRTTDGFLQLDTDESPVPFAFLRAPQTQQTFTQELQILSPDQSPIKWIVGAFYLHDKSGVDPLTFTIFGSPLINYTYQITNSESGFGQTTLPVFPAFIPDTHLTLGIRYTNDDRSESNFTNGPDGLLPGTTGSQSTSDGNFSYRAALDHSFTPDIFGYVSYDRGFKSGLFDTTSAIGAPNAGPAVKPETLDAYQVGFKSTFFDHRLRINVDGFYYDYDDLQVTTFLAAGPSLSNAASAKIHGADIDTELTPMRNLTLGVSTTVLDAYYSDFKNASFYGPAPLGLVSYVGDATGNRLPFAPRISSTATGQYRVPTQNGDFSFNASVSYKSAYYFEPQNLIRQKPFEMVNTSVRWTAPGDHYDLTLWGKNLTSAKWFAMGGATTLGGEYYSAGDPLTFGITAGAHFR